MLTAAAAMAQSSPKADDLPDAPTPKQNPAAAQQQKPDNPLEQTIQVLAKRSIFFPELAHDRGPLDSAQKFKLAIAETVAPSQFVGSAFTSAIGQARNDFPGYGQGWSGYGKRFGSSVASNAANQMFATSLLPTMTHQDPRYFVKLFGGPRSRILYAMERVLVTRTDDDHETFNLSNVLGGLMAESLANSYLPDAEHTAGKTFGRFGVRMGLEAVNNIVKEYWPNIFRSLRISKVVPSQTSDPGTVTPPVGPPAPPPNR
jgi:hypothetical protein